MTRIKITVISCQVLLICGVCSSISSYLLNGGVCIVKSQFCDGWEFVSLQSSRNFFVRVEIYEFAIKSHLFKGFKFMNCLSNETTHNDCSIVE